MSLQVKMKGNLISLAPQISCFYDEFHNEYLINKVKDNIWLRRWGFWLTLYIILGQNVMKTVVNTKTNFILFIFLFFCFSQD